MGVQGLEALEAGDGDQEIPAHEADEPLDLTFVVALAGPAKAIGEEVMRLKLAEDPGALTGPIAQDARHRQLGVVANFFNREDRARHPTEEGKGRHMAIAKGLTRLRPIGPHETGVRVWQIHRKDVDLAILAPDDGPRLAEVDLGMAGIVSQRYEDLLAALPAFPHVVFDDRIAAGETMLVPQPLEDPLGGVPPFTMYLPIRLQDPVDDAGKRIQLGASRRPATAIARRHRVCQHLVHRLAIDPEDPRRLALAHPIDMARPPHASIELH